MSFRDKRRKAPLDLGSEKRFHSTELVEIMIFRRKSRLVPQPDGSISCISDHPNGFEWCINAPAIDVSGTVYVQSEDGNACSIPQGHTGIFDMSSPDVHRLFLQLALGAAYTPLSIGEDGKLYTQNGGHLFVIGN